MVFDYTNHIALWTWLSQNPCATKKEWPGWEKISEKMIFEYSHCFACKYAFNCCDDCPLVWPDNGCTNKDKSLYDTWCGLVRFANNYTITMEEFKHYRKQIAHKIANLPIKERVEWI